MANINLVNWREKRRVILNTRFYVIAGLAVTMSIILALFVYMVIGSMIAGENENIEYLDIEIKSVENKIKQITDLQEQKSLLLNRRKVIESLQDSRPFVVKLFDNFARMVPDGIVVTQLVRKENEIIITGESTSNDNISELMKNVQNLKWVADARLGEIKIAESNAQETTTTTGSEAGANKKNIVTNIPKIGFELHITIDPVAAGTAPPPEEAEAKPAIKGAK